MCCIIHRPIDAKEIPSSNIEKIIKINPDGWGIAFIGNDGLLTSFKSLEMKDALTKIRELESQNKEFVFHARKATHGTICEQNCHPYEIQNGLLFHNGQINVFSWRKSMSDTWHFSKKVSKFLKKGKDIDSILTKFKSEIGESRLCIITETGEIIKHGNWFTIDGCDYSKKNWQWEYSKNNKSYGHYRGANYYKYSDYDYYQGWDDDEEFEYKNNKPSVIPYESIDNKKYLAQALNNRTKTSYSDIDNIRKNLQSGFFLMSSIEELTYNQLLNFVKEYPLVFAKLFKDKAELIRKYHLGRE